MPLILGNKNLELQIDRPGENYIAPRFDQTGKISKLSYQGIQVGTTELPSNNNPERNGSGFYNEFDIDHPSGFKQAQRGEWFHKIGVGLLRKNSDQYEFGQPYEMKPADFQIDGSKDKVTITCKGQNLNGYGYQLSKVIRLLENGFRLEYRLENTGDKTLNASEYVHNFIGIGQSELGEDYSLNLPETINPGVFHKVVNPDEKVQFQGNEARFSGNHKDPFFFSHLFGSHATRAHWKLVNTGYNLAISETGDFKASKMNLWGWRHVVSPELFIRIILNQGESHSWSRSYQIKSWK